MEVIPPCSSSQTKSSIQQRGCGIFRLFCSCFGRTVKSNNAHEVIFVQKRERSVYKDLTVKDVRDRGSHTVEKVVTNILQRLSEEDIRPTVSVHLVRMFSRRVVDQLKDGMTSLTVTMPHGKSSVLAVEMPIQASKNVAPGAQLMLTKTMEEAVNEIFTVIGEYVKPILRSHIVSNGLEIKAPLDIRDQLNGIANEIFAKLEKSDNVKLFITVRKASSITNKSDFVTVGSTRWICVSRECLEEKLSHNGKKGLKAYFQAETKQGTSVRLYRKLVITGKSKAS
ncbi:hypothetical protein [uncultured Endozoicomonas sp.]|uniref:hypothetical protein n=1 Tax=uncultured Endozoicomonas sp. TaxID=432652 RepID=UPI002615E371|nr:hypothetical protein [uncultured Endozoicomonas sp.]